jgi:2-oxoglutarate dehydrogenase E2 component (dihydrolipoamide succinyltransferase)
MAIEITVPALGESVTEATVGQWFKKPGDAVNVDEPLLELETDKVTLEVPAPVAGILAEIKVPEGSSVAVGSVLGSIDERVGAAAKTQLASESASARLVAAPVAPTRLIQTPPPAPRSPPTRLESSATPPPADARGGVPPAPAARKLMEEQGLSPDDVQGSGRRGQILKEDVLAAALRPSAPALAEAVAQPPAAARSAL